MTNNPPTETEQPQITVTVTDAMFHQLHRQSLAQRKQSLEQHCHDILRQSLEERIGAPTIDCPGALNGFSTKKITGPSWATEETANG